MHEVIAPDPEFAAALAARGERRRGTVGTLIARLDVPGDAAALTDIVTALTSQGFFAQLADRHGTGEATQMVTRLVDAAIDAGW